MSRHLQFSAPLEKVSLMKKSSTKPSPGQRKLEGARHWPIGMANVACQREFHHRWVHTFKKVLCGPKKPLSKPSEGANLFYRLTAKSRRTCCVRVASRAPCTPSFVRPLPNTELSVAPQGRGTRNPQRTTHNPKQKPRRARTYWYSRLPCIVHIIG
jgi:hypothetical protein